MILLQASSNLGYYVVFLIAVIIVFLVYKARRGYSYLKHVEPINASSDKKQITIKKHWIITIILSLLTGLFSVLIVNHYGQFSYMADTAVYNPYTGNTTYNNNIYPHTPIAYISYKSRFGSEIQDSNPKLNVGNFNLTDFGYDKRVQFYIKATVNDYLYILLFAVVIFTFIRFFKNFKLKIN